MASTIFAIIAVSLVAAALAAVLVLAERFIANYGECKITINNSDELTIEGGKSLLEVLTNEKIFIPSACGGRGTCGYCKVKITDGAGPLLPTETPFLTKEEIEKQIRLSCQVKVREDMKINIPEELLKVQQFQAICTEITDLTYDIKQFRFELKEPSQMDFIPGQYIQLFTPEYPGNTEEVYRAYSISSDPKEKNCIEVIIRLVPGGICTTYCFEHLKKGDTVYLNGPYGEFRLSETDAHMICVAGGSGMAPIKCILHHMQNINCQRKAAYFFGGRNVRDLFLDDLMKQFEQNLPNFKYIPVVGQAAEGETWDGKTGLVTEAVQQQYSDTSQHEAYLCGSPGMIDASVKVLTDLGMPEQNIFYDKFA
jgi:Na+-transporting NADH:ubiquinone oxidoreductase subunit F